MSIELVDLVSALSVLIPSAASIYFFRSASRDMRFFALFIILSLISSLAVTTLAIYQVNNLWLFHAFTPIEYGLLIYVFSFWQSQSMARILKWSIALFFLVWIGTILLQIEQFDHFYHPTRSLSTIILTIISLYTLIRISIQGENLIFRDYRSWIILGVLLSFTGTAIIFDLSDLALIRSVWTIHSILNVTGNLCFACAFLFVHSPSDPKGIVHE